MPELPDLQVFSRNLHKRIKGKTVKKVAVPVTKNLNVSVKELRKALEGEKVTRVYREGKELHIAFENGSTLGLHMMLKGNLHLFERKNQNKNPIIVLFFDDETGLALTDWQRAATPTLNPLKREAPDALSKALTSAYLEKRLEKTRTIIKTVLLNQKVIRGIGNAYADEILWQAKISPFSVSNRIPADKVRDLLKSISKVLNNAEKKILKSHPDIIHGEVRDFLDIHHPKKQKSPTGAMIRTKQAASRKTYYTDEQELYA